MSKLTAVPRARVLAPALRAGAVCLVGSILLPGCSPSGGATEADFEVVQVLPEASPQPTELLLNQELTVRFNAPIDRSTVSTDTVRVLDARGFAVAGELEVTSQSVKFVPRAPVQPDLADGSFAPDSDYTFEVVGFPRATAVRSAAGRVLGHTVVRRYHSVAADAKPALLPTGGAFGFALDSGSLGMAAGSERLRLFFYGAPDPTTVRPEAFRVIRLRAGDGHDFEELVPRTTSLRPLPHAYPQLPGWAVDLRFDEPPVGAPDYFAVKLVAGESMLRDPAGHPPRLVEIRDNGTAESSDVIGRALIVRVYPGEWVPLLEERFESTDGFRALGPASPRFEARDGCAVPRVRIEAGSGELGLLWPHVGTTILEPGRPFDRGDGVWVQSRSGDFQFTGIVVPRGCTVRIRGGVDGAPVILRACAGVQIDGELILEGTPRRQPPEVPEVSLSHLLEASGVTVMAACDVVVTGQVRWEPAAPGEVDEPGSPLTILGAGGVGLFGRLPQETVLATERGAPVTGTSQGSPLHVRVADLTPGLPPGTQLEARAATEWAALPRNRMPSVEVELRGASPGLVVEMQAAPPDSANTSRPDERPDTLLSPVPVPSPVAVTLPQDGFVRFLLRVPVRGGEPLPTLDGIVLRAAP